MPYCAYVTGMYEGAACCIHIASLRGERYAIIREVKCKAKGDKACRFIPISVPISTSVSEALEIFKDKIGPDRELLFKYIPLETSLEILRKYQPEVKA